MYRCMLKKESDTSAEVPAALVPLDAYRGSLESRYRPSCSLPPQADPESGFILYHQGLRDAGLERGLLARSTAHALWEVIAARVELVDTESCLDGVECGPIMA